MKTNETQAVVRIDKKMAVFDILLILFTFLNDGIDHGKDGSKNDAEKVPVIHKLIQITKAANPPIIIHAIIPSNTVQARKTCLEMNIRVATSTGGENINSHRNTQKEEMIFPVAASKM